MRTNTTLIDLDFLAATIALLFFRRIVKWRKQFSTKFTRRHDETEIFIGIS